MVNYIKFLWQERRVGFLIILFCAYLGSVRGAWKESKDFYIGVTQEDVAGMEYAGENAPDMVGVIPLASEQNRWHNFSYAAHYAVRGVGCYCILMAIYLPFYYCRFFVMLRTFFDKDV